MERIEESTKLALEITMKLNRLLELNEVPFRVIPSIMSVGELPDELIVKGILEQVTIIAKSHRTKS